jgi:hypothetical protein
MSNSLNIVLKGDLQCLSLEDLCRGWDHLGGICYGVKYSCLCSQAESLSFSASAGVGGLRLVSSVELPQKSAHRRHAGK